MSCRSRTRCQGREGEEAGEVRKVEKEVANLKCATCTGAHGVTGGNEENTSTRVVIFQTHAMEN